MNKVIKTTEDGWGCVPELKEAVKLMVQIDSIAYEIHNCKRATSLEVIVREMKNSLEEAIDVLDEIDVNRKFETIEDYS